MANINQINHDRELESIKNGEFNKHLTTLGLPEFIRRTVGFDRLFENAIRGGSWGDRSTNYPPYNVARYDDVHYAIEVAVAGFAMEELEVEVHENQLSIKGRPEKDIADASAPNYLYKGVSRRPFALGFTLADHVEVESANIEHGMLIVRLVHRIPEEKLPKRIAIEFKN